jgi:hypothetical protein
MRRRLANPLLLLLKQGLTPRSLALSVALGATLGLFPLLGTTMALCGLAGLALRLSHPALQLANYAVFPLQLSLVVAFVRLGERLMGAAPLPLSGERLVALVREDPPRSSGASGRTAFVLGWPRWRLSSAGPVRGPPAPAPARRRSPPRAPARSPALRLELGLTVLLAGLPDLLHIHRFSIVDIAWSGVLRPPCTPPSLRCRAAQLIAAMVTLWSLASPGTSRIAASSEEEGRYRAPPG